jgi:hypothetical protein
VIQFAVIMLLLRRELRLKLDAPIASPVPASAV